MNHKLINELFQRIVAILNKQNWLLIISILVLIPSITTYILGLINDKINNSYNLKKNFLAKLFKVITLPLIIILWLEPAYIGLKIGFPEISLMQLKYIDNLPSSIILFSFGWLLIRIISIIQEKIAISRKKDPSMKETKVPFQLLFRLLKICIILATLLFILQNMGVDILDLILFSGSYLSILGALTILNSILRIFYHKIISIVIKNSHFWIYILVKSLYLPLQILLILASLLISYKIAVIRWAVPETVSTIISKINSLSIIALVAWFFFRFSNMFEEQLLSGRLTKKQPSKTTGQLTSKLLKIFLLIILVLISLPIMGIPIEGILAFSGGSAIVVGIAVRPILENYFGGLLIYSDRFFEVGDWIHSPDRDIEGTVEDIGWRSTRIRTFDKRPLYVPNAVFSSISVINASRMSNRRIKETIPIRYEDAHVLENITRDVRNMLKENLDIDTTQTLLVHFTEFGPSSLNLNVYTFTKTRDWKKYRDIQQTVFLNVIELIGKNGGKLAVPEQRINIKNKINDITSTLPKT